MNRGGFTLIELLIVIAIIAILAGAMVPMFNVTREDARVAKAKAELDAIKTAAIMMHHDTGQWPPVGTDGTGLRTAGGIPNWNGPYIDPWATDPWGVNAYEIKDGTGETRYAASQGKTAGFDTPFPTGTDDHYIIITSDHTK